MTPRNFRTLALLLVPSLALATWAIGAEDEFKMLFDGTSLSGWKLNTGGDVPRANLQADGLNPHGSGGYIVIYDKPFEDFVLDFDYKISKGCNSGVFLRVGDAKDPVYTGLEIAIDDTIGTGFHDPGAFYDLVKPTTNAQKTVGDWNHMTITAKGAKIDVVLNEKKVSEIDLNHFKDAGTRPDGSKHKFEKLKGTDLIRAGFVGFQDHGQDCWYKNVKIKVLN